MIPDIAFMIVVYGIARLLLAAMEPHRRGNGQVAQATAIVSWALAAFAAVALALLGLAVADASASASNLIR